MPRKVLRKVFASVSRARRSKKFTQKRIRRAGNIRTKARSRAGNQTWTEDKITGQLHGGGNDIFQAGLGVGAAGIGLGGGVGLARGTIGFNQGRRRRR